MYKRQVKGASVINTDVWLSMGQESEGLSKEKHFYPYQVNRELLEPVSYTHLDVYKRQAHFFLPFQKENHIYGKVASVLAEQFLHAQNMGEQLPLVDVYKRQACASLASSTPDSTRRRSFRCVRSPGILFPSGL